MANNLERPKPDIAEIVALAQAGKHLEALRTWLDWMTWFYEPPGLLSEDRMTKWHFHERRFPGELDALAESAIAVAGEMQCSGAPCDSTPLIELTRPVRGPRTTFRAAWTEVEKFRAWQAANHRHDGNGTLGKVMAVEGDDGCEAEQVRERQSDGIPVEFRTEPMFMTDAALLLGYCASDSRADKDAGRKQVAREIGKTLAAEKLSPNSRKFWFDKRDFEAK